MRCSQNGLCSKQTKKRMLAIAFFACFVVAFLLSEAFVLTHANHEHDHNGQGGACATCEQVQNAENVLKQGAVAACGSLFILVGLFAAAAKRSISLSIPLLTPVAQKIRMNN